MSTLFSGEKPILTNNKINHYDEEVDLIDLIGYLWQWRFWIAAGSLLGAGLGTGWIYYKQNISPLHGTNSTHWILTYPIQERPGNVPVEVSSAVHMAYINSIPGAIEFYKALNAELKDSRFAIEEWVSRQGAGSGLIDSIEANGSDLIVEINDTGLLAEAEIREAFSKGFSVSIDSFNKSFGIPGENLRKEDFTAQLKLADLKLKALQIFTTKNRFSKETQNVVLEAASKSLSESSSISAFAMLITQSSEELDEKIQLMADFRQQINQIEGIKSREKAILKEAGTESLFVLNRVKPLKSAIPVVGKVDKNKTSGLYQKVWFGFGIGALTGLTLTILGIMTAAFLRENHDRLRSILRR